MREAGLDSVARVIRQRQRDRAGGRDGGVVREARSLFSQRIDELGLDLCDSLHVTAVAGVQHAAFDLVSDAQAIGLHFGAPAKHFLGDRETLVHDRSRSLLSGQRQCRFPTLDGHLPGNALGEFQRGLRAVFHAQHGERGSQPEIAHAVAAFALDLLALLAERQAVHLDHVVEHARERGDRFPKAFPVEACAIGERIEHELREVDRAQKACAVGGQGLLTTGIRGAYGLAEPVVVHLVDFVHENEPRLGKVVGGSHDQIPHAPRGDGAVDLAGHAPGIVDQIVLARRPFAPDHLGRVFHVETVILDFPRRGGEGQGPVSIVAHRLHELAGNQQRQIELAQATGFALAADEIHGVRVTDIESRHLRAPPPAGGRHGKTHLVVDIHEGQRPGSISTGTRDVRAFRAQGRELVADAAACLQREAGLVDLLEDVRHRITDRPRHGAIDGGGSRLVRLRAGIGDDTSSRNRAAFERAKKLLEPQLAITFRAFHGRQRFRDAAIGVFDVLVERLAVLGLQAILGIPDIQRSCLERDVRRMN